MVSMPTKIFYYDTLLNVFVPSDNATLLQEALLEPSFLLSFAWGASILLPLLHAFLRTIFCTALFLFLKNLLSHFVCCTLPLQLLLALQFLLVFSHAFRCFSALCLHHFLVLGHLVSASLLSYFVIFMNGMTNDVSTPSINQLICFCLNFHEL